MGYCSVRAYQGIVIPGHAGIQSVENWVPACPGMALEFAEMSQSAAGT